MISEFYFSARNYLVTGSGSGIGREITELLVSRDNNVFAVDKDMESLNFLSTKLNSARLNILTGDITREEIRKEIVERSANLDGIVNCAGIIKLIPFKFINEDFLSELDKNNYEAPLLLNSALLKKNRIKDGASIIFLSSIMSVISTQTNAVYTGTKAALAAVTKTMALETAPHKIRVNSVSPGFVKTPMLEYIGLQTDLKVAERNHPLGFGDAKDVAGPVMFLLSDASRWITGTNLIIDGGYCAK